MPIALLKSTYWWYPNPSSGFSTVAGSNINNNAQGGGALYGSRTYITSEYTNHIGVSGVTLTYSTYQDGVNYGTQAPCSMRLAQVETAVFPYMIVNNTLTGTRTITVHCLAYAPQPIRAHEIYLDLFYPSSASNMTYSFVSGANNASLTYVKPTANVVEDTVTWVQPPTFGVPFKKFKLTATVNIAQARPIILRIVAHESGATKWECFVSPWIDIV